MLLMNRNQILAQMFRIKLNKWPVMTPFLENPKIYDLLKPDPKTLKALT